MAIDFVKIDYTDKNYLLPTDKTDFIISVNNETGETDGKKTGQYFDMKIIKYESGRTQISGSLHKFHNKTDFNGNDFDFENLYFAIADLNKDLAINPYFCKLENIEIGVNIQLPFSPNKILQNLLFHRNTEFNRTISGVFYYQSKKDEYYIKIYNKSAQYERRLKEIESSLRQKQTPTEKQKLQFQKKVIQEHLKPNTLRFEVKYVKMRKLNDLGLFYITDILKLDIINKLKILLLKEFDEVCFYDYTTDEDRMRKTEREKIKDYRNPNYWSHLNKGNKFNHKNKFEEITLKYSKNTKGKVLEILEQKIDKIITKSLDFFTDNLDQNEKPKFRLFHRSNIGWKSPNELPKNNSGFEVEKKRVCKVTKIDISMQKKGSKFLCISGLKYYRENDPETYKGIEEKYLTEKMISRPIADQLYYIAHNIRNEKTNVKNNPIHSRKRFEERNYPKQQLQINFTDY